jgi:hypothetical protein
MAVLGAIVGATLVGTVLTPKPPRTHYYERANQAAQTSDNKARPQNSLWVPDDSTGFYALWTALFTFVLAISTILLWSETAKSSGIAKTALTEIERAFIYLDGFETEVSTGEDIKGMTDEEVPPRYRGSRELYITRFAVAPKWKNSGSTPPKKMTIQVNWCGPEGDVILYRYRKPPIPFFVGPNAVETSASFEIPGAGAIVDWSWHPVGDQPLVLIWGRADYEDIFDKAHFVEWCYRVTFSRPYRLQRLRAIFTQWEEYNRTDST